MPSDNLMNDIPTLRWPSDGELEVLTFGLGGETLAIEAMHVQEILDVLPRTAVPGADPLVSHVINFRGRVIPLADLHPAFGMNPAAMTPDNRIIVVTLPIGDDGHLVGINADKVHEVITLRADACEMPSPIGMRWPRSHLRTLVRHGTGVILVPDLHAILAALAN